MKQNRVKKRLNSCDKFTFSIEFQLEVLRFLVQGKEALLYVTKIKPGYFTLTLNSSRGLGKIRKEIPTNTK